MKLLLKLDYDGNPYIVLVSHKSMIVYPCATAYLLIEHPNQDENGIIYRNCYGR